MTSTLNDMKVDAIKTEDRVANLKTDCSTYGKLIHEVTTSDITKKKIWPSLKVSYGIKARPGE